MTPEYEFASTDLTQHLYHFAKKNAKFITDDPKKKAAVTPPVPAAPPAGGAPPTPAAPVVPQTPPASPAGA
jgi:hypothetical protein